ncbi:hypothetical protein FBU30_005613 [Linnemannia zychae]|nr:hypothetical protein FBU30_005613 [Linnemannia zychae]
MTAEASSQKLKQGLSVIPADVKVRTKERTSGHPHPYLNGNFYPVFEETVGDEGIECEVIGTIPEVLRGSQYIRTGPNTLNVPSDGAPHHFFTGMLHGVYFESGSDSKGPIRPRYMNRYVRSDFFKKQNKHGYLHAPLGIFMNPTSPLKFFIHFIWYYLKIFWYKATNVGDGNTALAYFGSRLLALQEAGKPVETAVPSLNTTGEYYFEEEGSTKKDKQAVVTAHPKIDPKTGEFIFFSYSLKKPCAFYSVISAEGKRKVWAQKIPLVKPTMMHDFATTETYSIIVNCPMYLDTNNVKNGQPLINFETNAKSRFGIIPRYFNASSDKIQWFESPTCHIFHTANAWDEKDKDGNIIAVCMTACRSNRFIKDINLFQPTGPENYCGGKTEAERLIQYKAPGAGDYDNQDPDDSYLTLFRFDLRTGQTQLTTLSQTSAEFPVINFARYMQPDLQYVFTASTEANPGVGAKFNGIIKTDVRAIIQKKNALAAANKLKTVNVGGDGGWEIGTENLAALQAQTSQAHRFGPHIYGNEAMFVANSPRADGQPLAEDDGFLLVYVYDERQMENGVPKDKARQVTELWIFDAKKIGQDIDPVAKVKIPRRVPYGFHGLHLTKEQIKENQEFLARRAASQATRA